VQTIGKVSRLADVENAIAGVLEYVNPRLMRSLPDGFLNGLVNHDTLGACPRILNNPQMTQIYAD